MIRYTMKAGFFLSLILFLFLCGPKVFSQEQEPRDFEGPIVYFEFGGSNLHHSANYEQVFVHNWRSKVSWRAGFISRYIKSTFGHKQTFWSIPLSLQLFTNIRSSHHPEVGIGFNYIHGNGQDRDGISSKTIVFTPSIGYRFQKPNGGLFIRLLFTPGFIVKEFESVHHVSEQDREGFYQSYGLSLGYFHSRGRKK
jgi:hypothetical protein